MKTLKITIALASFCFFSLTGQAQTASTIEPMESNYQSCLDKGENMLKCSKAFYWQMDSVLNSVYNKLRFALNSTQIAQLKKEQLQWLGKRDKYFQQTKSEFKKIHPDVDPSGEALGAQDDAMIMYDQNAAFVQERVLVLVVKMKKTRVK